MPVISLIAARGALPRGTVESLRNAWGGGDAVWLSDGEAAEFPVDAVPGHREDVRAELSEIGIDLNLVPAEGRRKKLLLADMDSTMIRQECIDELAEVAGVGDRVREITARAMNGELDFEGALRERVGLLEGLNTSVIDRVLTERIEEMPGGRVLLATMRAGGAHTMLVSGGFTAFAEPLAQRIGFHEARANRLLSENGKLTGKVAEPILGREAKVAALDELVARLGLTYAETLAVGDGANDLGMLGKAGMGVALHAKRTVAAQAGLRVDHGDLTALLFLQGYARDEFVVV